MKILIAVSQRSDTNTHNRLIDNLENKYIEYLERFGIYTIAIPNSTHNIPEYFKLPIKGVVLTGGNDVDPALYGGIAQKCSSVSSKRDYTEKKILEIAIESRLPVLGICRGMQFINVYFGGSLSQGLSKGNQSSSHVAGTHLVNLTDQRLIDSLGGNSFTVNSFHERVVAPSNLSYQLNTFVEAEDGVIEGLYHPDYPIFGIQWHPERESADTNLDDFLMKSFCQGKSFWRDM